MGETPFADLTPAVTAIAAEAGALATARGGGGAVPAWQKAGGSPVCQVDLDVDRLLRQRLTALLPEAGWLSEESVDEPDRLTRRRVWVVDPIDGTRDFIRGRTGWCVSVALVEDGRPVLSVLDAPARGEVWVAHAGGGAWRNGVPVAAGARDELNGARIPADTLSRLERELFVAVAKPNSIALRMAMVAADEADLLTTLRWGNEWDIAAAVLIAGEAGAAVSDALGRPLAFNQREPRAFGLIAAAPGIAAAAARWLAPRAEAMLAS